MSRFLSGSFILVALITTMSCENREMNFFQYLDCFTYYWHEDLWKECHNATPCLRSNFTVQLSSDPYSYTVKTVNSFYPVYGSYEIDLYEVLTQLKSRDLENLNLFLVEMSNFHLLGERERRQFKVRVSEGDFGFSSAGASSQKNVSDAVNSVLEIARFIIQLNETGRIVHRLWKASGRFWEAAEDKVKDAVKINVKNLVFDDPEAIAKEPVFGYRSSDSNEFYYFRLYYYILVPLFDSTCVNPESRILISNDDLPSFYRKNRYF